MQNNKNFSKNFAYKISLTNFAPQNALSGTILLHFVIK